MLARRRLRRLARHVALGLCAFAGGAFANALAGSSAEANPQAESPYAAMGQLGRVLVTVESDYVDPVDRAKIVNGAIAGMVAELDPHSAYMPPQEYKEFQSDTEGQFGGIGVEVDARTDAITVLNPIEGAPAERAGIKSGDRIVAVDGQPLVGTTFDKLLKKMRGAPGTHVKVTLRREGVKEPLDFDLVREIVHVPSIVSQLLVGNIAYLRIKQFQEHTHDDMLRAIGKLRAAASGPLVGVLFDLRSNPGGLVDEAAAVADEFLTQGTIYTMRHRGTVVEEASAHGGGAFADLPVVTLVNEWSASASELVTGALQDQKRTLVVGVRTFGKGSVQTILDLPGGAGIRLTTARYYTPSGHGIQADGVHPDVLVQPDGDARPSLRESDLEGALAAQGASTGDAGVVVTYSTSGAAGAPADPLSVRVIPTDPSSSTDPVLKVGFGILRDRLVGHGPIVR